jgi:hypothetical protein
MISPIEEQRLDFYISSIGIKQQTKPMKHLKQLKLSFFPELSAPMYTPL